MVSVASQGDLTASPIPRLRPRTFCNYRQYLRAKRFRTLIFHKAAHQDVHNLRDPGIGNFDEVSGPFPTFHHPLFNPISDVTIALKLCVEAHPYFPSLTR